MQIAGGCYLERCDEPHWYQLYGSGGRAAASLAMRSNKVSLSTYLPSDQVANLSCIEATYGFQAKVTESDTAISFYYTHPLATPRIRPEPRAITQLPAINIDGETLLRFGFLEGTAIVKGSYVTYDPQSAFDPRPFTENGSSADHLAIVCNAKEVLQLSGEKTVEAAAEHLVNAGAEVVVVKMGSAGAYVKTSKDIAQVPAFKTSRVWPIGSGDVFASIFAWEWGESRRDPVEAAQIASRSTAYYCDTQTLPLPLSEELPRFDPVQPREHDQVPPSVYLAGPFFTSSQRWLVNQMRSCLADQGLKVFSPFHDVGLGVAEDVVPKDIEAIKTCSAMLAILDGLDSGTLFEVGYARALNIPVVGIVQAESEESMKMVAGTGCRLCDDIASAVYHTTWAASDG